MNKLTVVRFHQTVASVSIAGHSRACWRHSPISCIKWRKWCCSTWRGRRCCSLKRSTSYSRSRKGSSPWFILQGCLTADWKCGERWDRFKSHIHAGEQRVSSAASQIMWSSHSLSSYFAARKWRAHILTEWIACRRSNATFLFILFVFPLQELHQQFELPSDRPCFRRANVYHFPNEPYKDGYLRSPHLVLNHPSLGDGKVPAAVRCDP